MTEKRNNLKQMINIKETQEWYAKERGVKIEEFDDYDIHVCRVANSYANTIIVNKSDLYSEIYDIITNYIREDITKMEAIDNLLGLHGLK